MKTNYKFPFQVIEKGANLGYAPAKLPLLFLVPFVQVAWAEGFVQAAERRAILRFAENFNVLTDDDNHAQLNEWLDERPSDEFFSESCADLRELLEDIPPKHAARLRSMLQFGCVEVANAAGDIGLLRGRSSVRREEREHLRHIGEQLGLTQSHV